VGVSRDCPIFLGYPLLSQERVKLRTSNLAGIFTGSIRIKAHLKILEKTERGRIQGLPKFFGYRLLSQERVKVRTSNFVGTFIGSIGTKAHETLGIVAVGVVRESRKFSGHPYVGRIARSSLR